MYMEMKPTFLDPITPENAVLLLIDQQEGLSSLAEGYDTYVVVDVCGLFSPSPSIAAISRLSQAGVALVDTRPVALEMMADNAHPKAQQIYVALAAGLKEGKEK